MRRSFVLLSVIAVTSVMLSPARAQAAGPLDVEVAGSYVFLNALGYGNDYHAGWLFDAAVPLPGRWAVAGEIGSSHDTASGLLNATFKDFMIGPRFASPANGVIPFAQILFGSVQYGNDIAGHVSDFALQPGGGVDIPMAKSVFIRLQADYRIVPIGGDILKQFRLATGVVFRTWR